MTLRVTKAQLGLMLRPDAVQRARRDAADYSDWNNALPLLRFPGSSKPPTKKRKPALEVRTHIAIADLLRARTEPGWWWSHIGHGEKRSPTTGALLKRMGLRRGIPDFVFVSPVGKHCYLELKRGNAPLTDAQEAFRDMCFERGISHHIARSYEEAVDVLRGWGVIP